MCVRTHTYLDWEYHWVCLCVCISYLYHCCNKVIVTTKCNFKGERVYSASQFKVTVHLGKEGTAAGTWDRWLHCNHSQGEKGEYMLLFSSLSPFYSPRSQPREGTTHSGQISWPHRMQQEGSESSSHPLSLVSSFSIYGRVNFLITILTLGPKILLNLSTTFRKCCV